MTSLDTFSKFIFVHRWTNPVVIMNTLDAKMLAQLQPCCPCGSARHNLISLVCFHCPATTLFDFVDIEEWIVLNM